MRAYLKNYRQAPRKVRLVADMIRGKRVGDALSMLSFTQKKAAPQLQKLLRSAVANAKQQGVADTDNLRIKRMSVDKGFTFTRLRARARGRAAPINRESSHVTLELDTSEPNLKARAKGRKAKKENVTSVTSHNS